MIDRQNIARGAFFIVASEISFALSAAIIKLVSADLPNETIVFFRSFFGLLILVPFILKSDSKIFQTERFPLHLLRAGFGVAGMYSFFYAVGQISLGDSMLIKSTSPLIIPFMSAIWLHEKITPRIILAGGIGFLGVFLILQPDGNTHWASLVALASSIFAASAFVTVRKLSATEPPLRIVAYFTIFGLTISSIPMFWHWQTPTLKQYIMLIGISIATTMFQVLLTRGYQNAPASSLGIFTYTSVPFGTFLGWLIWKEVLDLNFLFGAGLIIIAGIIILRSKAVLAKNKQ